jgi:ABC-type Fe3+-siderophore transport system permease subunit
MNNKLYDFIKWFLMIFIPAAIGLIITLGKIYHFETETVVLTISAIATFLGAITGISSYNYNKED